jgi:DNA modification methylase
MPFLDLRLGDAVTVLRTLPAESVHCVVTSPPYWGLRDYGTPGQLGLEATPEEYVAKMVEVFREVKRVLRKDGTLWLNMGDSYCNTDKWGGGGSNTGKQTVAGDGEVPSWAVRRRREPFGLKPKDLVGIPWRLAFALQADGWYLRADIIWSKPNPMPESVTDRPTKAHEYVFLLSKSPRYYYDAEAIREPWTSGRDDMREHGVRTGLAYLQQSEVSSNDTKVIPKRADKRRGHGRRHAGFNDRWDEMPKAEQMANGRNKRSVWEIATQPYPEAHFATFPEALVQPCILAGCPEGGTVLDPFVGSGTTALVANTLGRKAIGIELNPAYLELAQHRCAQTFLSQFLEPEPAPV